MNEVEEELNRHYNQPLFTNEKMNTCKVCKKQTEVKSRTKFGEQIILTFSCGHMQIIRPPKDPLEKYEAVTSFHKGFKPFKFQAEGAVFVENAGFRCLIADEMRLGKTIQSLIVLREHPELFPILIICRSNIIIQWFRQCLEWLGKEHLPFILENAKDKFNPVFDTFIISMDLLHRMKDFNQWNIKTIIIDECQHIKNPEAKRTKAVREICKEVFEEDRKFSNKSTDRIETIAKDLMIYHQITPRFKLLFEEMPVIWKDYLGLTECIAAKEGIIEGRIIINLKHAKADPEEEVIDTILHEIAHAITPGAGHSPIWKQTFLNIGGSGNIYGRCEGTIALKKDKIIRPKNVIALSGTPVQNNAGEFFTILNILRPELFPTETGYQASFCEFNGMKIGGIRRNRIESFKNYTKDFIIRRTRDEVMPDLPKIQRTFSYHELEESVRKEYLKTVLKFNDEYDDLESRGKSVASSESLLAYIAHMRKITGLAKVDPIYDDICEFLESTNRKLTVFVHHKDVHSILEMRMGSVPFLSFKSELSHEKRAEVIDRFWKEDTRVLIASTQSGGEGINLACCSDAIMMERQLNPSKEMQAEARFSGPESKATHVTVDYPTAIGTIDEWLTELLAKKEGYIKSALDGQYTELEENSLMKELMGVIRMKGASKWKLT